MISSNPLRVALTAAVFGCAVAAAQADECDTMTKTVEVMIDEMKSATGQVGAKSLKELTNITILHKGAIEFAPGQSQIGSP